MENKKEIKVVELFAGVGGFHIGLSKASDTFKIIWANQWEPSTKKQDAFEIYNRQFGDDICDNRDICKIPTSEIPDCDLLVGGFPCQDYSVATTLNNSKGIEGKKGVLWWEIYRILSEKQNKPNFLFLENVDRLLKSPAKQRGRDFAIMLVCLSDLDYIVEWRVINAADYGMPQRRKRTYIVAYRNNTNTAKECCKFNDKFNWIFRESILNKSFKGKENTTKHLRSHFIINGDIKSVSSDFNKNNKFVFEDAGLMVDRNVYTSGYLPVYYGSYMTLGNILIDELEVPESFFIPSEEIGDDSNPAKGTWRWFKGHKVIPRIDSQGHAYNYCEGAMAFPDSIEKPSRTIITGEGGPSASRFKHVIPTSSGRFRRLTPVELERLNMFPDNHTEGVSDVKRAFLMGNALVTGVIEKIGKIIISKFDKENEK